jgi:hypothetical protein
MLTIATVLIHAADVSNGASRVAELNYERSARRAFALPQFWVKSEGIFASKARTDPVTGTGNSSSVFCSLPKLRGIGTEGVE